MPRTGTYEDPSPRKLSKEMVVAPALWRRSFGYIIKHIADLNEVHKHA